jgi:hypothetical protein
LTPLRGFKLRESPRIRARVPMAQPAPPGGLRSRFWA